MSWTNLIVEDRQLLDKYSAQSLPTYYLVEGDSKKILAKNLRGSDLEAFINGILEKKTKPAPAGPRALRGRRPARSW